MNSKVIAIVVIGLVVIGAGVFLLTQNNATPATDESMDASGIEESMLTPTATDSSQSGEMDQAVKEFTVNGDNFTFDLKEIKVKKGDTVRIVFNNTEGTHDLVLDEFDVATKMLQAGGTETVEFVADQTGEFEYYCSVGSHRQMGMKGTLIVE